LERNAEMIQAMAKRFLCLVALGILLGSTLIIRGQVRELALATPRQHLNDFAAAVDSSTTLRLENVLVNLNDRTGINFVVVTVKTAGQDDLFSLSNSMAKQWTIGSAARAD